MRSRSHTDRKSEHIRICLEEPVQALGVTTGLERWRLEHQALPEMSLAETDLSLTLAGKALRSPFVISAMTGGTPEAGEINRHLALAAQELGLAMVLGSQRPAIEDPSLADTYHVRRWAPDILLFANLGAVQLNEGYGLAQCREAVDMVEADGLALHLNPLQELLQPEGDSDFRGLAGKIGEIAAALDLPVLVKEVGWGISARVAALLGEAGVRLVEVAGAGGTSWSAVESYRAENDASRRVAEAFADWGIPTADAILNVRRTTPNTEIIASGGIRTGVEAAKALALGARAVGVALPLLRPALGSASEVIELVRELERQLRIAMTCTSSHRLTDLASALAPAP